MRVDFGEDIGGDGGSLTDDASTTTGLFNGGHITRFLYGLSQMIRIIRFALTAILSAPGTNATSITSISIPTVGSPRTLTIQAGKTIVVGMEFRCVVTAVPNGYFQGLVTAYNSATGSITINPTRVSGTGTYANWTLSLVGSSKVTGVEELLYEDLLTTSSMGGELKLVGNVGKDKSLWFHNGVRYVPAGGSVVIAQPAGSVGAPLASFAGSVSSSGSFAITNPVINANLLRAGSRVRVSGRVRKSSGVSSTLVVTSRLGASGGSADGIVTRNVMPTAAGSEVEFFGEARLASSTTFSASRSLVPNSPLSGGDSATETIDVTVANQVSVNFSGLLSGDTVSLINLAVEVSP